MIFPACAACSQDTPKNGDNVGAGVERFRDAPRFASNVAVHRSPDNVSATSLFAIDSDMNKVIYRARTGTTLFVHRQVQLLEEHRNSLLRPKVTRIAACSADANGKPQVFVIADKAQNLILVRFCQTARGLLVDVRSSQRGRRGGGYRCCLPM